MIVLLTVQPGDHISATFRCPAEFARRTADFAGQALTAYAKVLVFPRPADRDELGAVQRYLAGRSPALRAATGSGRLQVLDSRQVQLAPGKLDPGHLHAAYAAATEEAVASGYSGLWMSVDMSWAADAEPAALVECEAAAFPLFTSRELTVLCHYDLGVFGPDRVTAACRAHPAGLDSRWPLRHQRLPDNRTLRLTGETDLANATAFAALIRGLRPGDILDVSGMTFLDVRALTSVARAVADLGDLTVHATRSQRDLLDLVRAAGAVRPPRR
ncbi:hypothetical protein BJY16_005934 [Actinoplanes octamycinicus]|uniref:MEDS domain-containing protein n=1 Tax=Actinoplanes octamycinicus TaxID=135948 RepID=A0A7W7H1W3_9ACTN|nr:MEDS domain-containing protein [Actinoplanes octamycinicus]MBB4742475.1 hypothetical protein [Actinoplanes octamycinicus]GIE60813.1 hypothetical protein Aoc01nite_62150 [Actinoplanes octamycinicus]